MIISIYPSPLEGEGLDGGYKQGRFPPTFLLPLQGGGNSLGRIA